MEQKNNVNLSLFIQLAKVNNKMNEKRSHGYQSMDPEYVTGQINSRSLELFSILHRVAPIKFFLP